MNTQSSGSKNDRSIGVHASNIENSDTEDEDYPLRASDMNELKNPAISIHQNTPNLYETVGEFQMRSPRRSIITKQYYRHFKAN